MFRVLDVRTGELAISLDYFSPEQLDQAFRQPAKENHLRCPICRDTVILRQGFDAIPHFMHPKGSRCRQADESIKLLELRAALYGHLRREFGHGVTAEHDLPNKKVPRSVDCWVEVGKKKFGYWILDMEIPAKSKRLALRAACESEGATLHFVCASSIHKGIGDTSVQLSETERFAKASTPYDVLDGVLEGGSLHYLAKRDLDSVLLTYRTLRNDTDTDVFNGIRKQHPLSETEVCPHTGCLVHPGEKTHAEIVRTRKAREEFERESQPDHPEAICRREWELVTRRSPRTNESLAQIMKRLLRPRSDLPSIQLWQDREAPCEFCGVVTRDWIVYSGKTGKCKCRTCYESISAAKWRARHEPPGNAA